MRFGKERALRCFKQAETSPFAKRNPWNSFRLQNKKANASERGCAAVFMTPVFFRGKEGGTHWNPLNMKEISEGIRNRAGARAARVIAEKNYSPEIKRM
jgi:hypothetical protein